MKLKKNFYGCPQFIIIKKTLRSLLSETALRSQKQSAYTKNLSEPLR